LAFGRRNRRDAEAEEDLAFDRYMDDEFQRETGPKRFSFNELAYATNNFNDDEKLGQGGFGGVYKGFLRDSNSFIAVKRVSKGSKQGIKEYASEVKIISRLRHRNLVQLIGWCHERRELVLVYEFMPNGSLDSHLFTEESLLIWAMRYKVAQGLGSALLYLHEEWEQCVVHRDIKSSNIMLDSNFNAKLGDFGLARLVDHVKGSQTTVLAGTMGYMAPECVTTGKASKESDVYSFGIVALEIACGRKPIKPSAPEDQVVMVEWVWELYGIGKVLEAADPRLSGHFDEQQMERLMIVGLWCAHPDRNLRPSIRQTIHVLNFEAPLPILSSNMPRLAHYAPVVNRHSMSHSISSLATEYEGGQNPYSSTGYTNSQCLPHTP
jgi:serine/threonine protein kinase